MPRRITVSDFMRIVIVFIISWGVIGRTNVPKYNSETFKILNSFYNNIAKSYDLLNKITLTQKGYIQFLRYVVDVPTITEFTFCIWMRSVNLTHAHPLLSYSEHETTRYIRSWISPRGKEINLAILESAIIKVPTNFKENKWYHICQSWESSTGSWSFYLNGKLQISSQEPKLKGLIIPKGGDMVVGQEYTDFDKGLDDGIEGDIFGFNLVLSSTISNNEFSNNFIAPYDVIERRAFNPQVNYVPHIKRYSNSRRDPQTQLHISEDYRYLLPPERNSQDEIPSVLSYFTVGANRLPKQLLEDYSYIQPKQILGRATIEEFNSDDDRKIIHFHNVFQPLAPSSTFISPERANKRITSSDSRIVNDIIGLTHKPLGLQLVELSYNCALGKGSPINHEKVLLSWTKTPVRVFGGAILRNVFPFCLPH